MEGEWKWNGRDRWIDRQMGLVCIYMPTLLPFKLSYLLNSLPSPSLHSPSSPLPSSPLPSSPLPVELIPDSPRSRAHPELSHPHRFRQIFSFPVMAGFILSLSLYVSLGVENLPLTCYTPPPPLPYRRRRRAERGSARSSKNK